MNFQEYPKALYLKGAQVIVQNEAEEAAKREEGFTDWQADHGAMSAPTQAVPALTPAPADTPPANPAPLDREALKARATSLGIEFARNVTTEKLAELVAAHGQ